MVRMQIREKPYTWSVIGRVTGVTDHGESYLIAPLDGSQVKLRNRRFVKPKEPESYELAGAPEHHSSLPDIRTAVDRAPVAGDEDLNDKLRAERIRKDKRLKRLRDALKCADSLAVPWDLSPSANTRSRRN